MTYLMNTLWFGIKALQESSPKFDITNAHSTLISQTDLYIKVLTSLRASKAQR